VPHIEQLPPDLEDGAALAKRRANAASRKELWRSVYSDAYRFAMPARESFNWTTEGQFRNNILYDSTLQETTYTAANTLCALLFPGWTKWANLAPGGDIDKSKITPEILAKLSAATDTFFDFLNHSNFPQVINETALDLMVGTGALCFDEGDDKNPFVFSSIPLSALELEEGPNGTVETTFMLRKPLVRNLTRMYEGMSVFDLPENLAAKIVPEPDAEVEIIQAEIYHPDTKKYYGVVMTVADKAIIWRFDYGTSCPTIVARATKMAGELYGRGRVLLALSDARTLDKMQEFVLRHAALSVSGVMTGVSDGVLNPYTAVLAPGAVIPVASNDSGNPSLRVMDIGGNFQITEVIMSDLRQRVRRTMLGPEPTEGAVRSATEVSVNDRNRLWAMNGELGRIQAELLEKIVARGVFILQRRGLIEKFNIDGRQVAVKYTSPFAKSQDAEEALAVQHAISAMIPFGDAAAQLIAQELRVEKLPAFFMEKYGADMGLVRTEPEKQELMQRAQENAAKMQAAQAEGQMPQG
jgi:hypothetical protein